MGIGRKITDFGRLLTDRASIESTVNRLVDDGLLPPDKGVFLKRNLSDIIRQSRYVLLNLGAHMAMGAIFAFDIIPLPMGVISRVVWVLGNRIYSEVRRDDEKRKVHSVTVLMVSAIPWVGYFAYTLPLRRVSEDAAYLYANHVTYVRRSASLVGYIQGKPAIVRRIVERLLIPNDIRTYLASGGHASGKAQNQPVD